MLGCTRRGGAADEPVAGRRVDEEFSGGRNSVIGKGGERSSSVGKAASASPMALEQWISGDLVVGKQRGERRCARI
jgi:hypothetical protein